MWTTAHLHHLKDDASKRLHMLISLDGQGSRTEWIVQAAEFRCVSDGTSVGGHPLGGAVAVHERKRGLTPASTGRTASSSFS